MFAVEVVSPPAHLPVSVTDEALAAAVVEEVERNGLVACHRLGRQAPRSVIDGSLAPERLELEPVR